MYALPAPGGPVQPQYLPPVVNGHHQVLPAAPAAVELGPLFRSSRSLTTSSSTLSLLPIPTASTDWTSWNTVVSAAIWTLGAMGHITNDEDTDDPLLRVVHPPDLFQDYTQPELSAYMTFWQLDTAVTSILAARLGKGPAAFIPPINKIIKDKLTARQIYGMLKKRYANKDYTNGFIQKVQLCTTRYTSGSPEDFILSWRSGVERL